MKVLFVISSGCLYGFHLDGLYRISLLEVDFFFQVGWQLTLLRRQGQKKENL